MRTKEEAATFLRSTSIFETREEVWRALLEYNPGIHGNLCVDELSSKQVDDLLRMHHDKVVMPVKAVAWKSPARDQEFSVDRRGPLCGFRENVNMDVVKRAGMRLWKKAFKGSFVSISVIRNYHSIARMTS